MLVLGFFRPAPVQGEDAASESWLILPSSARGGPSPAGVGRLLEELARAVREKDVFPVASDEARALFEARHSTEAVPVSESDLDVVAREARAALFSVATGRNARARQSVARVLERAERALESLNRETDYARHVLNACLYLVRAMLESGNRDAALSRVLECRRLVPDIEPDRHDHPPKVIELLREAETRLATAPTGSLRIESEPSGCDVYLNGRHLGDTPYEIRELPPGEYRIQAECHSDRPGRVHRVALAAEPTLVRIDAGFDRIVRTEGPLHLVYPDSTKEERRRHGDGLEVARIVGATSVLLVTPLPAHRARIDRVRLGDGRVVSSVILATNGGRPALRRRTARAVDALASGTPVDLSSGEPEALAAWAPPSKPLRRADADADAAGERPGRGSATALVAAREAPQRRDPNVGDRGWRARSGPHPVGWVLGVAGVVGVATGWGLFRRLQDRNDAFAEAMSGDENYLVLQGRVDDAKVRTAVVGATGGALLTTAIPLLLPERDGVPGWSWALGTVGMGLTAWGLVPLFGGDAKPFLDKGCVDDVVPGCTRRTQTRLAGMLLLFTGAPLVAMPVTHLVRSATGREPRVSADMAATGDGLQATLRGSF